MGCITTSFLPLGRTAGAPSTSDLRISLDFTPPALEALPYGMSVATAPTCLIGRLLESARTMPSQGWPYLMEFLRAPLTILRARSIPIGSAPTMLASMRRLPVPQKGSRNASPGWTPERLTSARESLGKMAEGWKKALLRGLLVAHPCLIEHGVVIARYVLPRSPT